MEFEGQRVSWKFVNSCDKAFTELISNMLDDERIQSYIGSE